MRFALIGILGLLCSSMAEKSQDFQQPEAAQKINSQNFPQHDGLYISLAASTGLGELFNASVIDSNGLSKKEFFGNAGLFSAKAGIAIWNGSATITADALAGGVTVLDAGPEYDVGLLGIGAAYHLKSWNASLSGSVGRTFSDFIDVEGNRNHDRGMGYQIQLQKEWWHLIQKGEAFYGLGITAYYLNSGIDPSTNAKLHGSILALNFNFTLIANPFFN